MFYCRRLGLFPGWQFVGCETFLPHYGAGSASTLFFINTPFIFSFQGHHQLSTFISSSFITVQAAKSRRSQYTIHKSTNFSDNNNSFNVQNNYSVVDDRSQLLAWLSPLEPKLRHQDIRERRVENVGEWLMQTGEFRSRRDCGGGEDHKEVLFCYGAPGVGKTFVR